MFRRTLNVAVMSCLSMASGVMAEMPAERPVAVKTSHTADVRISTLMNRPVADASGSMLGHVQDVVLNPVQARAEWVIVATNAKATQPAGRIAVPWMALVLPATNMANEPIQVATAKAIPLEGHGLPSRLTSADAVGWQRTWRVLHGCDVRAIDGTNVGGVDDAVIDATGHVQCVAILLSGVRAASDRRIVLPMNRMTCTPDDASVQVAETVATLASQPTLPVATVVVATR